MKLELIRGDEKAVLEADDDLMDTNFYYQVIFERSRTELLQRFYPNRAQEGAP